MPARPASHGHGRRPARKTARHRDQSRRRRRRARRSAASCRASPCRPGQDRDCPAGQRDAARRERRGRAPGAAREDARTPAEEFFIGKHRLRTLERRPDRRVAGNERTHPDAEGAHRRRQRARDIGEAARLDERIDLRGDAEDRDHAAFVSLSIIGWVIRQMPLSVRRKRRSSSCGSSPTTRPSGIRTPRSTTTFFRCAPRPTCT